MNNKQSPQAKVANVSNKEISMCISNKQLSKLIVACILTCKEENQLRNMVIKFQPDAMARLFDMLRGRFLRLLEDASIISVASTLALTEEQSEVEMGSIQVLPEHVLAAYTVTDGAQRIHIPRVVYFTDA